MDLNPISQPNNSLSDCLNGTIITYDGNEFNLQNDFGNYSLKNCSLQQGFVPVGMKSYGDIIYIASCSKDGKLCELGTYPSPKYPKLDELDYSTNNQAYAENLELENNYKPLWNYSVNGTRQNFTTGLLNFDLDHPVNIEIQPSYDGSVNLILNDNKNEPRLINSGFSIYENRKARLVKRNQKEATNLYLEEKFKNQIRLKKVVEKISRFELLDVPSTGQLKGGNYTFYLKMADGDYNKSDIVAESGQISIFKGNSTSINSIHGTLLNETTDKAIQLRIDNIDTSFSNFYILYSREFSDLNGVRQYETFELTKPFEINNNDLTEIAGEKCFTIQINGTEQTNQISEEEINIEYIPINAVKTQAQQQNMLFLGNIKSEKTEYKKLQDIAYNITVQLLQNTEGIGWVDASYKSSNGEEYYNPKTIYNNLGYWPEEYYRFGIVFIKDDDTLTPAFNLLGKEFSNIGDTNIGCNINLENYANNNYIYTKSPYWNKNGIFKNPNQNTNKVQNYNSKSVFPWYYKFTIPDNINELKEVGVKGYFIVRQKRVPTILCQGMSISIDKTSHTPMLYDPDFNPTQGNFTRRICNGEIFFNEDKNKKSDGIEFKPATKQDKYFTESFLANFQDKYLWDSPFNKTGDKVYDYHMYLVSDGRSILNIEKGDKKYTALGDHIIRTDKEHKQCSAILSLDACVIPELQSQLNGESRILIPQDQLQFHAVTTKELVSSDNVWDLNKISSAISLLSTFVKDVHNKLKKLFDTYKYRFINPFNGNVFGNVIPNFTIIQTPEDVTYWMNCYDEDSFINFNGKHILLPELSMVRWEELCSEIRNKDLKTKSESQTNDEEVNLLSDEPTTNPEYLITPRFGKILLKTSEISMNPDLFKRDDIWYGQDTVEVYDAENNLIDTTALSFSVDNGHCGLRTFKIDILNYGYLKGYTIFYSPNLIMKYTSNIKYPEFMCFYNVPKGDYPKYIYNETIGEISIAKETVQSLIDCSKIEITEEGVWTNQIGEVRDINHNPLYNITLVWQRTKPTKGFSNDYFVIIGFYDRGATLQEVLFTDGPINNNIANCYDKVNKITEITISESGSSITPDPNPNPSTPDDSNYIDFIKLFIEINGSNYFNLRKETINQIYATQDSQAQGDGYIHGNVKFSGSPCYFTRAFKYDSLVKESQQVTKTSNKVIFVNSGNVTKAIPHPSDKEKNLIFTTQAGDPSDVSKVAIFGEGDEFRNSKYGPQFKWALRGIYCPILGIDDVGDSANPFLAENTIYNIYTDNYDPDNQNDIKRWFLARSVDNAPYYAVTDRYDLNTKNLNVYRGDCFTNTVSFRINRNFIDPDVPIVNEVLQYSSWAENASSGLTKTTKEDWAKVNRADVNAVSLGMWVTFKCMSNYNLGIRSENRQHTDEMALLGNPRSFFPLAGISAECGQKIEESWLLNSGYNATVGRKTNLLNQKLPYQKTDYSNRVMFSNIAVKDSFSNGYRVFQGASYRDIDNQYGEITKLIPWGNNLFCVFEHGCAIIPVNEKALMQTTTEQTIHIYGYGVLPDQLSVISQDFGSIWADSIIRTPLGIYGVDSSAKKIWRYTDSKGFETISDMVVQRFLNDNLLVTESDKYTNVLIRNIKTHYNAYKGDVMFTFIKDNFTWNICYNERQGMWITKYSWMPVYSENINNQFYSFSLDQSKEGEAKLYLHGRTGVFDEIDYTDNNPANQLKPTKWYDKQEPFEFEFVVTQDAGLHKIFDNLILVSNNVQPESIQFSLIGDSYLFNKARLYHDSENNPINIYKNTDDGFNKENLRGTIENPYTPIETPYLKNTKIQYDPILDQYELVMEQQTKNMETFGRRLGNIHYKEDAWYLVFDPIVFDENINSQSVEQTNPKWKTVPLKDKWLKIRIKYRGDQLAIITALNTIYRLTSS